MAQAGVGFLNSGWEWLLGLGIFEVFFAGGKGQGEKEEEGFAETHRTIKKKSGKSVEGNSKLLSWAPHRREPFVIASIW